MEPDPVERNARERIHQIFTAVLDLPAATRRDEVRRLCDGNPATVKAVFELLDEDEREQSPLDADLENLAANALSGRAPDGSGQQIGRYRLLRLLGEGGMGVVYLAERIDIGGQVALKILQHPWMSPMRRQRFAQEQRLLAKLSHPNIACIFDAETLADGAPWFAMEFADGVAITDYVRAKHASLSEVVGLFCQVCEAVQYAHRLAIIHRDLKPSNVLVTGSGLVKLLDFGIAKLLEGDTNTERTIEGLRLMTPDYAAPEQLSGADVGVFTDVYALGVLLRELLTGSRSTEMVEGEQSRRRRHADGVIATKQEWWELNLICRTAAHPDPEQRYQSVEALLADLAAFREGRPLLARRDSVWYVARKFAGRNRTSLAIAAAASALLLITAVGFTVRLAKARDAALAEVTRTNRLLRFTESLFDGGDSTVAPSSDLRAITLLDRGQIEADGLRDDPQMQAEMRATLGRAFEHLGDLTRAQKLIRQASDEKLRQFGETSAEYAGALLLTGELEKDQGQIEGSIRTLRRALKLARQTYRADEPKQLPFQNALAAALTQHGDYAESKALLSEAVRIGSTERKAHLEAAKSLEELGDVEYYLARYDESARYEQRALQAYRELYRSAHPSIAQVLDTLGNISAQQGHLQEAERFFREALDTDLAWYGAEHPAVAQGLTSLAKVVSSNHRTAEARAMLERALAIKRKTFGDVHPQVALTWNELGVLADGADQEAEAERDFQQALEIWRKTYGEHHQFVGLGYANLAGVYLSRREYERAEKMCRKALQVYAEALPSNHPNVAVLHVKLGRILLREGKYNAAEPETLAGYHFFAQHESGLRSYAVGSRKDLVEIERKLRHRDVLQMLQASTPASPSAH